MSEFADNKKVAKNTIVLYLRMLVMMAIAFYTTRIVVQILGVSDMGIMNVVGGIVSSIAVINSSMTISVQRFLSYSIGLKNQSDIKKTFITAVHIHFIIALIVVALAETVGLYFLLHYINYPPERHVAVLWVYHLSVFCVFWTIMQIPYTAAIVAYERMSVYAWFTISDVVIRLLFICLLIHIACDKLIFVSVFDTFVTVLMFFIPFFYVRYQFKATRYAWLWDKKKIKEMCHFAGWSALGELSWVATLQGVNILLNIFFGPAVNGVRGIAFKVKELVNRFVASFQMALNPQIIKLYADNDITMMQQQVYRGTCLSFYLALMLALPVMLRTDYLLIFWLGSLPEYLNIFSQLILVNVLLDILSNMLTTVAKAYGKIAKYQACVACVLSLNLVGTYLLFSLGFPPFYAFVVYGVVSSMLLILRLFLIRQMIPQYTIRKYITSVLFPILGVCVLSVPLPFIVNYYAPDNFMGLIYVGLSVLLSVGGSVYGFGLSQGERNMFNQKIRTFIFSCKR